MSLYSFEGDKFVVFAYFVYNGVKVGTPLSIRLQLNENSVVVFFYAKMTERKLCDHQPQPPQEAGVNRAAFGGVNAGGVDAAVAQDIRQAGQVFLNGVKCPGKQMAKIVGEYLGRRYACTLAKGLHFPPDIASVQRFSVPADKHRSGGDFLFLEIGFQQFPQFVRQENGAALALVADFGAATLHCLGSDEAQFTDPDAGGADGLDDQGQPLVFLPLGGPDKAHILGAGQFPVLGEKEGLLDFQLPQPQLALAAEG